jgi:hypothetical protein
MSATPRPHQPYRIGLTFSSGACARHLASRNFRELAATELLRAHSDAEPAHRATGAHRERATRRQRDRDVVAILLVAALEHRARSIVPADVEIHRPKSRVAPTRVALRELRRARVGVGRIFVRRDHGSASFAAKLDQR